MFEVRSLEIKFCKKMKSRRGFVKLHMKKSKDAVTALRLMNKPRVIFGVSDIGLENLIFRHGVAVFPFDYLTSKLPLNRRGTASFSFDQ